MSGPVTVISYPSSNVEHGAIRYGRHHPLQKPNIRPNRQMIRSPPRFQTMVRPGVEDFHVVAHHDAVEACDGAAAVEAGAGVGDVVGADEFGKAAALMRPFVEVAHHDRRDRGGAAVDAVQDRADLLASAQAGQIEVHADNPHAFAAHGNVRHHCAARFQRREVDGILIKNHMCSFYQDRITMPANRRGPAGEFYGLVVAVFRDQFERKRRFPRAVTPVCLLDRDDIRVDFRDDVQNPFGPPHPVRANSLANVIAGHLDHGGGA
jgi:hypothetical protein